MDVELPDDDELAGTPDSGGGDDPIDLDDTSDFYEEVDDDDMEDKVEPEDNEMVAMIDILQTLGVEPEDANRFSSRIMKISHQPLNPSFVEMYGCGNRVHAANNVLRNVNVSGLCAFDLRTSKPSGEAWDFSKKSDRMQALKYVKEKKPTWVVGSPPCTAFSQLQGLNFPKMDPDRVARNMKEAKAHLHFVIYLYHIQLAEGPHFLQRATSWKDPRMLRLLKHPKVGTTVADQCMYGLTTKDANGKEVKAKKPTQWASSAPHVEAAEHPV